MKTEKLNLPEFWATALINGDVSGFDMLEIDGFDRFLRWAESEGFGACLDVGEERSFLQYHDASAWVLACDCLEYTFEVTQ